jgi:outer membrane assembly lipoprotein YfiO
MRFSSSALSFVTLCALPFWVSATHSPQELEAHSAKQEAPHTTFLATSSIKEAPTFLLSKNLSRKEKDTLRKKLKKMMSGKVVRTMTEEELRTAADLCLSLQWYEQSLTYLKKIEKKTKNTTVAKNVKLEIADINFQEGNLKTAAKLYDDYINLYPGDKEKAAYAKYKGILSNFYCMLKKDRDQTATHKTIALADAFLESNSTLFRKYAYDVESIKNHCFTRLYEHDAVVFDFYLKKESFKAAENRLTSMRTLLLSKRPDLEPRFLECEIRIAQAQHDTPRITRVSKELASRFPEEVRVAQAKKIIPNYVTRF